MLSLLTAHRLRERAFLLDNPPPQDDPEPRLRAIEAWLCPICKDAFTWEDEAEKCCQGEDTVEPPKTAAGIPCPACGADAKDHYEAADCCLWRDIAPPDRFRIAQMAEAGMEWAEAIDQVAGAKP